MPSFPINNEFAVKSHGSCPQLRANVATRRGIGKEKHFCPMPCLNSYFGAIQRRAAANQSLAGFTMTAGTLRRFTISLKLATSVSTILLRREI